MSWFWRRKAGSLRFDGSTFSQVTESAYSKLLTTANDLYAVSGQDVFRVVNNAPELAFTFADANVKDLAALDGDIWAATEKRGIHNLSSSGSVLVDGPLTNYIGEVMVDAQGRLWATCGLQRDELRQGIFVRDESQWTNYFFLGQSPGIAYRFMNSSMALHEDRGWQCLGWRLGWRRHGV